MTRHARNATASSVYSYHEKKKDAKASGYGTKSMRIPKESIRDFDCCCLTLQPCHNPVVTPDGYLYEKEALLEYILTKKTENARKMKAYLKQKKQQKSEEEENKEAAQRSKVQNFLSVENSIVSKPLNAFHNNDAGPSSTISNMSHGKEKTLPSFWIPALTPAASKLNLEKPGGTGFSAVNTSLKASVARPVLQV